MVVAESSAALQGALSPVLQHDPHAVFDVVDFGGVLAVAGGAGHVAHEHRGSVVLGLCVRVVFSQHFAVGSLHVDSELFDVGHQVVLFFGGFGTDDVDVAVDSQKFEALAFRKGTVVGDSAGEAVVFGNVFQIGDFDGGVSCSDAELFLIFILTSREFAKFKESLNKVENQKFLEGTYLNWLLEDLALTSMPG